MSGGFRGTCTVACMALVLAVIGFAPVVAAAQGFTVGVNVENETVNPQSDETATFNISVTNTADTTRQFAIDYTVANPGWYFLHPYALTLEPNETGYAALYADPGKDAVEGNKGAYISVSSGEETEEKRAFFKIRQDRDILLLDYDVSNTTLNPGDNVSASLQVKNVRRTELDLNEYRAVFTLGNDAEQRANTVPLNDLDPGETATLSATFALDRFDVGMIPLTAAVEDLDGNVEGTESANIAVRTMENVQRQREQEFGGVAATTTITAMNVGNVPATDETLEATVPWYLSYFVSFTEDPAETVSNNGMTGYVWNVGDIPAGGKATVTYRVNYWMPIALVFLLITVTGVMIREYRKPKIRKKTLQRNGRHSVHVEVENRSGKTLGDVAVTDFVPGIAALVEKFDATPPERIRKGDDGTKLEWQLGDMAPGEKRILTYQISPQVAVEESVTLPAATLQYNGRRERKRQSHVTTAQFQ